MVVDPGNAAQSGIALGDGHDEDGDDENAGAEASAQAGAAKLLHAALRTESSAEDATKVSREAVRPVPTMWR